MSPTIASVDEIDIDISVAYISLGVARSRWAHCPSAENARLVDEAEATVNGLLEMRFAGQQ